ncbi:asparagine-rich protein-like [Vanessa cardui]|uniref:asparagine-rich protein-like n=1 Tax=Vanessa cardui TaxID=171605 RepID=UPI001F147F0D|nr:asparagine-rich protein-like [Vanessa cardui]
MDIEPQNTDLMKKQFVEKSHVEQLLSSEPLASENVRESRQLNFGECCPCHDTQRSADYDAIEAATTLDNCPCLSAPDSESAPSIFKPTVRAVEPFMRSNEAKTPKPLLKPEVGLASSVLETLQEVTDQEYQEALVRDATRTALNDKEENLLETEMANTPRNIVNIILQPKDGNTMDDVMPEASHTQETRCVHPSSSSLGRANTFDQMRLKPRYNVLGKAFPSSTVKSVKPKNAMIEDRELNDCDVNLYNARNFKDTTYIKSTESMDADTSPSELKSIVMDKPINKQSSKEKYFDEDKKNDMHLSPIFNNNMQNQISVKETVPEKYAIEENKDYNGFMAKNVENDKFENKSSDRHSCDADEAGTSNIFEMTNIPQTEGKNSDNVNDFGIDEDNLLNTATLPLTTTEKSFVNHDIFKTNDNKIFPNLKADVLKTLEKIKNANVKIQDKLRLNAKTVQNLDVINNSSTEIESSTLKVPKNDIEENFTNKSNDINTQDLQEMSDRILNLSLTNEKLVEPLGLDSVGINNNTNVDMDNEISPSESKNTIISANNLNKMKDSTPSSSDSVLKSSDDMEDLVETIHETNQNRDNINNDVIDSTSRKNLCENVAPKFSDKNEVTSSNDQEKEMMTQASSPFVNSVRHTGQDYIVQPESNLNVKGFLDNLKSSLSDIFKNNENMNTNKGDIDNNNSNKKTIYLERTEQNNLNKSPFSFNEPKNIDTVKSYSQTRTQDALSNWDKNNRLKSYKARVPIPDSLNLKTVPSLPNRKQDTIEGPSKDDAEVRFK